MNKKVFERLQEDVWTQTGWSLEMDENDNLIYVRKASPLGEDFFIEIQLSENDSTSEQLDAVLESMKQEYDIQREQLREYIDGEIVYIVPMSIEEMTIWLGYADFEGSMRDAVDIGHEMYDPNEIFNFWIDDGEVLALKEKLPIGARIGVTSYYCDSDYRKAHEKFLPHGMQGIVTEITDRGICVAWDDPSYTNRLSNFDKYVILDK